MKGGFIDNFIGEIGVKWIVFYKLACLVFRGGKIMYLVFISLR